MSFFRSFSTKNLKLKIKKPLPSNKKLELSSEMRAFMNQELFVPTDNVFPETVTEKSDSSIEGFFAKRQFSLDNFNMLLKMLCHQGKKTEAFDLVSKMQLMGFPPNTSTYNHLIGVCGRSSDLETAEKLFSEASRNRSISVASLYTSLISSYAHHKDPDTVAKILREKKDKGMELLPVDHTCYITSLISARRHREALTYYRTAKTLGPPDEFLILAGIQACAKTNEAEYALAQWDYLLDLCVPDTFHYNQIIAVLGRRKDYAEKALEMYDQMLAVGLSVDTRSINAALTACSRQGDLLKTQEILRDMKSFDIAMDPAKYSLLFATYSEACVNSDDNKRDALLKDSWELFRQCQEQGIVNSFILNGLLSVHTKAYREHDAEGLVIPLFKQYSIELDKHSYRHLLTMYYKLNENQIIRNLWSQMLQKNAPVDMYILNTVLANAIRSYDTDQVSEILFKFKETGYRPLYCYLKRMFEMNDLPMRIWAQLQDFPFFLTEHFNEQYAKRLRIDANEEKFTK